MDDTELLLTVEEAARVLRLSRAFTYELIARGELPVIRFGRRVLIPREALRQHVLAELGDGGLAGASVASNSAWVRVPSPPPPRQTPSIRR